MNRVMFDEVLKKVRETNLFGAQGFRNVLGVSIPSSLSVSLNRPSRPRRTPFRVGSILDITRKANCSSVSPTFINVHCTVYSLKETKIHCLINWYRWLITYAKCAMLKGT